MPVRGRFDRARKCVRPAQAGSGDEPSARGVVPIDEARFYTLSREGISHGFTMRGAKSGRPRQLHIETEEQWAAIRRAQAFVPAGQPLGRPGKR